MIPKWTVIAGCTAIVLALTAWAQGAEGSYTLLIQTSPPDGGVVSPGVGVLAMPVGQDVPLSATPNQGYRFAYWLGDVSSGGDTETVVLIDSPKLVVAVFVREDFEEKLPGISVIEGQADAGGQRYIGSPIESPASVNPASGTFDNSFNWPDITRNGRSDNDNNPEDSDIPVPGDDKDDDIPVPGDGEVPEPATILLLGLGSILLLRIPRT